MSKNLHQRGAQGRHAAAKELQALVNENKVSQVYDCTRIKVFTHDHHMREGETILGSLTMTEEFEVVEMEYSEDDILYYLVDEDDNEVGFVIEEDGVEVECYYEGFDGDEYELVEEAPNEPAPKPYVPEKAEDHGYLHKLAAIASHEGGKARSKAEVQLEKVRGKAEVQVDKAKAAGLKVQGRQRFGHHARKPAGDYRRPECHRQGRRRNRQRTERSLRRHHGQLRIFGSEQSPPQASVKSMVEARRIELRSMVNPWAGSTSLVVARGLRAAKAQRPRCGPESVLS